MTPKHDSPHLRVATPSPNPTWGTAWPRGTSTGYLYLVFGLIPLREGVDSPWVSLLGLSIGFLYQFLFLIVCVFLHRVLGVLIVLSRGSPYLRMLQDGKPTVSTVNNCRHGSKRDWTGAPPRSVQGHRGGGGAEETPSKPESS
jgi:hypothetical protein